MSSTDRELANAIQTGDMAKVESFIDAEPELAKQYFATAGFFSTKKDSFINIALQYNQIDIAKFLLAKGAEFVADFDGEIKHSLISAVKSGNLELIRWVVENSTNIPTYQNNAKDAVGDLWHPAIAFKNLAICQYWLEQGFDVVKGEAESGSIISRFAKGLPETDFDLFKQITELLLDAGADINLTTFQEKSSLLQISPPLMVTTYLGKDKFTRFLMDKGALIGKIVTSDGGSFLHQAIKMGDPPSYLVQEAFSNCDPTLATKKGETPLLMAASRGKTAMVKRLLELGAGTTINTPTESDERPLLLAVENGHLETALILVEHGADINATGNRKKTVLDICLKHYSDSELTKVLKERGATTSFGQSGVELTDAIGDLYGLIDSGEPWADKAFADIAAAKPEQQKRWVELIKHCHKNETAKPSKKWLNEAASLTENISTSEVRKCLLQWLPLLNKKRNRGGEGDDPNDAWMYASSDWKISSSNTKVLKGLAWLGSTYADDEMAVALRRTAEQTFKKVKQVGMRNAKVANAALYALSVMPDETGIKEIAILRAQTKYNAALVNINRVFERVAKERGTSTEELAAQAVSDYGLTRCGYYEEQLDDYTAQVSIKSAGKCSLVWVNKDGKEQKSAPAAVNTTHADPIKQIKALVKDLEKASSAQSQRLENDYLNTDPFDNIDVWYKRYIDHPLVGFLGRRLVWRFNVKEGGVADGIWHDGEFVDQQGTAINWQSANSLCLWHPIYSSTEEIKQWRDYLISHEITQPFKQVFREIYIITDAEKKAGDSSRRFANHILLQHQFNALAASRYWSQTLGGHWDGGGETEAYKRLKNHNLLACYKTSPVDKLGSTIAGIYVCVETAEVTFHRNDEYKPVPLETIDPLVFSEVMRDIDLFVAVTSVSNDPDWEHRQEFNYWHNNGFGLLSNTANTRKEVLNTLMPRLSIGNKMAIEGNFVKVTGKHRTYKIHLGSGNILMEPDDSYLCIVPKSNAKGEGVYLPFDGDARLSHILSKAFMLVADDKIKDETILSQIHRTGLLRIN